MDKIITSNDMVYLFRLALAILAGAVIGYEREQKFKVAGLRTHILISMSAALMMIISKYAFLDVVLQYSTTAVRVDVSRVAAGIIAGMGILSGGLIFIGKRGNVSGLTTAAGIWATIGIGMVIGSGMYAVGIGAVILVEIVQVVLHNDPVLRHEIKASAVFALKNADKDYDRIAKDLERQKVKISAVKIEKKSGSEAELRCFLTFDSRYGRDDVVRIMSGISETEKYELP
ncbi:MAG: MgtC/SapB family protein [Lachnospiraceae bacterium]|nr:MgtC/SapB family protein [Lachnospiraceae bacterium]